MEQELVEKADYPPTDPPTAPYSPSSELPPSYYPPDQTAYPPDQTAYPPDQTAYPPAQTAYPPADKTAYPPPQSAYYNPNQTAYPHAENGYPAPPPVQMQQQMQSNVVVVSNQPSQPTVVTHRNHNSGAGQGAMVFAVIVSIFAFCCCWWALFCSIPAMVFAQNANTAATEQSAKTNRNVSLVLSGVTLFTGLAGVAILFGVIFGVYVPSIQRITTSRNCFYYC